MFLEHACECCGKSGGLPLKRIAQLLQTSITQMSDMENGKTGTTMARLVLLAEFYHVSTDYLLGITDDPAWRGRRGVSRPPRFSGTSTDIL